MNPQSKPKVDGQQTRAARTCLLVQEWVEEEFEVLVGCAAPAGPPASVDPWNLEAVGAADDPSRFRIDVDDLEAAVPDPQC